MSSDSDEEIMDLGASETESDTGSDNESDSEEESEGENKPSSADLIRKKITEKYKACHGKQLFVRFPARLPENEAEFQKKARALSPLIVNAHKPRQKHARFCLVDFNSQSDRDQALKNLRTAIKKDATFKGIVALIPRTEAEGFVEELIKKKIQSIESKKAKARLKWAAKRQKREREFTSMVVVRNLPANVSMIEMRKLFPNAVDIQLNPHGDKKKKSSVATVTLPSSFDAREAVRKKLSLGGTPLSIRFDVSRTKKDKPDDSNDQQKNDEANNKAEKKATKAKTKKLLKA